MIAHFPSSVARQNYSWSILLSALVGKMWHVAEAGSSRNLCRVPHSENAEAAPERLPRVFFAEFTLHKAPQRCWRVPVAPYSANTRTWQSSVPCVALLFFKEFAEVSCNILCKDKNLAASSATHHICWTFVGFHAWQRQELGNHLCHAPRFYSSGVCRVRHARTRQCSGHVAPPLIGHFV